MQLNEYEAAIKYKISPELFRWFTIYAPKNDKKKLNYTKKDELYYFDDKDLSDFTSFLYEPWPLPPKGTRPHIPKGIQEEIKKEAHFRCPICNTNVGEIAHIKAVAHTLCNHPHNLIYLCPNHHTVYDFGFKYNNISEEEVISFKNALLIFQCTLWKLKSNMITTYLSLINTLRKFIVIEDIISDAVSPSEIEEIYQYVAMQAKTIKETTQVNKLEEYSGLLLNDSKREYVHKIIGKHDFLIEEKTREGFLLCPLCDGSGYTDFFDNCPVCDGEGIISKEASSTVDLGKYTINNCPLCEGHGNTDDFEVCPPCHGKGKLTREQIDNIDFTRFNFKDCPLCEGHGNTDDFEECPPCRGKGKLTREQIDNIDFRIFKKMYNK